MSIKQKVTSRVSEVDETLENHTSIAMEQAKATVFAFLLGTLGLSGNKAHKFVYGADRAQMTTGADKAVNLVVGLMVGGLVAAFLLPVAINEIVGVDTSSWGSGASSIWNIMDLIIVLAVFLFFIGIALRYK